MGIKIIHQTGKNDFERVNAQYKKLNIDADVLIFQKIFQIRWQKLILQLVVQVHRLYGNCVQIHCQHFIPYKYAAGDHQYYNAKVLFDKGMCF